MSCAGVVVHEFLGGLICRPRNGAGLSPTTAATWTTAASSGRDSEHDRVGSPMHLFEKGKISPSSIWVPELARC